MTKRLGSSALAAALIAASLACGESPTVVNDPTVSIDGPSVVELSCRLTGSAQYKAITGGGVAKRMEWSVNGEVIPNVTSGTLDYNFSDEGEHLISAKAIGQDDTVAASDSMITYANPPADLTSCFNQSRISGDFAFLIASENEVPMATYEVKVPRAIDSIDQLTWTRRHLSDNNTDTIASGVDTRAVDVSFTGTGDYQLAVDLQLGSGSYQVTKNVGVRSGEPVSEPGTLVFWSKSRSEEGGLYYMDGETGLVEGPIFEDERLGGDLQCEPGGDRMILSLLTKDEDADMFTGSNLWIMKNDGTNQRQLTNTEGLTFGASWSVHDIALFLDDTRAYPADEAFTINVEGFGAGTAFGEPGDRNYIGSRTRWSPDGRFFAISAAHFTVGDSTENRIAIFNRNGSGRRPLHSLPLWQAYPGAAYVVEGSGGLVWANQELMVYGVSLTDSLYQSTGYIASANADGSGDIQMLTEGFGSIAVSASGKTVFFRRAWTQYDEEGNYIRITSQIHQIPIDGGEAINLSGITDPDAYDTVGDWCPIEF